MRVLHFLIMGAAGLLSRETEPSAEQVREALSEHLCRGGTYVRIERAVLRAAAEVRANGASS